jgi:hypothetical protein
MTKRKRVGSRVKVMKARTSRVLRREPKTLRRRSKKSLARWRKMRKVNRSRRKVLILRRPNARRLPVTGWPPRCTRLTSNEVIATTRISDMAMRTRSRRRF